MRPGHVGGRRRGPGRPDLAHRPRFAPKKCLANQKSGPTGNYPVVTPAPHKERVVFLGKFSPGSIQGLVERAYASQLPPGSVVALSLSLNVLGSPRPDPAGGFSAVLLPALSRMEQQGRSKDLASAATLLIIILIAAAGTLVLFLSSDFLVRCCFARQIHRRSRRPNFNDYKLMSISLIAYS